MLLVEEAHHPILVHEEDGVVRRRGRGSHPDGLTRQAPFAKELADPQHRHDGLSACLREHRELHATLLDVHDVIAPVALSEDDVGAPVLDDLSRNPAESRKAWALNVRFGFDDMAISLAIFYRRKCPALSSVHTFWASLSRDYRSWALARQARTRAVSCGIENGFVT